MAYYRREWTVLLRSAVGLTHHTFGLRWPAALWGAWLVLRANQLWRRIRTTIQSELGRRWSAFIAWLPASLVRSYAGLLSAVHHL